MEKLPTTLEECHKLIQLLLDTINNLSKRVEMQEIENRYLKERLNNNSSNSSLPPSKDFKKKKKSTRQPSGKKSGGQPGHKGHYRELLPSDQVDFIQTCELPTDCPCGGKIKLTGDYVRHQVYELPVLKLDITEYQLQQGCCDRCRHKHVADLPKGVTWGITGPRLTGFMSELTIQYGLSRSEQKAFLEEHFNFSISIGTVFNKQKIVNAALQSPVDELLPILKESEGVHADETGHNRDGKKQWLWGFISPVAAYFSIQSSRGKKVLRSMMEDFKNILISDRYAVYNIFDSDRRQMCWAHLKRDFTKLSEKDDKIIARIGKNLLESESSLFKIWYDFKSEKITRDTLLRQAKPIRQRIGELLEQGSYTDPSLRAVRFCKNLLENFDALWTFLETDDIEPTNNLAERSLRHWVIWRKKYFCTKSDYGSEFVARSASIITTCKLHRKRSIEFLTTLMENHFSGKQTSARLLMV
jgi:transposase